MANGQVSWFEVMGQDAAALRGFYGKLFGWTFDTNLPGMDYGVVQGGEGALPGGVGGAGGASWTTFYVQVDDVDAAIGQAIEGGGKVLMPARDLPTTRIAVVADPEGHPVGLSCPR